MIITRNGLMNGFDSFPKPPSLVFHPNGLIQGDGNTDLAF